MKRWTVFSSYIRSFPAGSISLEPAFLFVRRPGGERFTVSGLNRKRSRASDYHPLPPGKAQRDSGSSHRLDLPAPPADPVDTAHGQPVFAGQRTTAPRWRLTGGIILEDAQNVNRQEEEIFRKRHARLFNRRWPQINAEGKRKAAKASSRTAYQR